MNTHECRTAEKEREIQKEQKPSFHHLLRLFLYVFRATKGISCIYLGLFVLLSFLRPLIAEIWGRYISVVENAGNRVTEAALMLVLYWGISFAADLLESYLAPGRWRRFRAAGYDSGQSAAGAFQGTSAEKSQFCFARVFRGACDERPDAPGHLILPGTAGTESTGK